MDAGARVAMLPYPCPKFEINKPLIINDTETPERRREWDSCHGLGGGFVRQRINGKKTIRSCRPYFEMDV